MTELKSPIQILTWAVFFSKLKYYLEISRELFVYLVKCLHVTQRNHYKC